MAGAAALHLAEYLEDASVGTVGTNIFSGKLRATPAEQVALLPYPGAPPEHVCGGGMTISKERVQVLARSTTHAAAEALSWLCAQALSAIANQTIEGSRYRSVMLMQTPGILEYDADHNIVFVFNVEAEREV